MTFEDMDVWKRAVGLSVSVYKSIKHLKDYGFKDQIGRASLSMPSNLAEGLERISVKDSLNFLSYAKASCGELYTQLLIAKEIEYIESELAKSMMVEVKEISRVIGSLINRRKEFI